MSLDEQQPIRSLSGTTSVWFHSADQSSGASTPVAVAGVNAVSTSSSLRLATTTTTTNNANGVQHPLSSHGYAHRQVHSQRQNQSPTRTVAANNVVSSAYPDRGTQSVVRDDRGVRKFGSAAIPIVRPSPASQATVGAIGDGRKRAVLGNANLSEVPASSEVEQTAVLLRSLDITPPLSVQSVNSSATTPVSQGSSAEPPRLRIDPYGQYPSPAGHPYHRRPVFDPFFDSADTPVTQSPTTPDRNDQFDPPMGFNSVSSFVGEGGFLSRHSSQESMNKAYPFHPQEGRFTLPNINTTVQSNPTTVSNASHIGPSDASLLAIRAAQMCHNLFTAHQDPPGSLSFSAANSDVSNASFPNAETHVFSGSNQRITYANAFSLPVNKNDAHFLPLHEPVPYLRSPSPYWRYLPISGSESLPQAPLEAIPGMAMTLDGDSGVTAESMKQDGWVTSSAGYHDMVQQEDKRAAHRLPTALFPAIGSWNSGIASWSTHQSQPDCSLSRSSSMEVNAVSGVPKSMASAPGMPQTAPSSFTIQPFSPSHEVSGLSRQGESAFDLSGRSPTLYRQTVNATVPWPPGAPNGVAEIATNVSPSKTSLPTGHKSHLSYPNMSTFIPSFVPSLPQVPDGPMPQFLSQVQGITADQARASFSQPRFNGLRSEEDENINFLQLLQPDAKPPYNVLVNRIVRKSDQQASIFIQQKLKNASTEERSRIVNAIVERGLDMMQGRFGNWCVQRCLEGPCSRENRMKIIECMTGHVVEMATNCYGTHVIQKALECEEDIKRVIVNELLDNDPAFTLTSKHCSHVWAKVMELSWHEGPSPPIFKVVNQSLRGKWASLACHETGSLVVQTMFENMDEAEDKRIIVDEILDNLDDVVKNQWGAFVIQHIIEHGNAAVSHRTSLSLINNMAIYGTHDIAVKSILKILKEKNPLTQDAAVTKMCEPNINASRNKRPIIVDLALSSNGSQLIQAVLPDANKEQRARLYDAVKGHTVTLRGCKTGSRVIWLFDRMVRSAPLVTEERTEVLPVTILLLNQRAYYGY